MLIGINYPWIDYGWDFGDPPQAWVAHENLPAWRERKRKQIEEDFRRFSSQGIFAVRWFLLADGMNYGTGRFAPEKAGNRWAFDPLPAGHPFYRQFCNDIEFVLQTCAKHGLKLFPSLIDFQWCHQGSAIEGNDGIIKGGRYDIIRDPVKRQAFFDRTLNPLLEASAAYRDAIYAWELINEPEWVIRKFSLFGKKDANRNVSRGEMKDFITEGISRINGKLLPDGGIAFRSSVGFAHWESLETWNSKNLGITLHQFHYYAQENCSLPPRPYAEDHPCVVGEFATAVERDWPDLQRLQKDQTVAHRLCCVEEKGYPACFLWSARAVDAATRWTADEHQAITAYTGSH
jgi:hypothetical protein